jgi:hypothetical protein
MAIESLHFDPARKVGYREEVTHPALSLPEVASGLLGVAPDGRLLKEQHIPFRETSEVGDSFVSIRKPPEAGPNLLPIPDKYRPMLDAMRFVITGNRAAIAEHFDLALQTGASGWVIGLSSRRPGNSAMMVSISGCGAVLQGFEILQADNVRRVITIESAQ